MMSSKMVLKVGIPSVFFMVETSYENCTLYDIYLSTALNANFEHQKGFEKAMENPPQLRTVSLTLDFCKSLFKVNLVKIRSMLSVSVLVSL